jgi:hypothetical protein
VRARGEEAAEVELVGRQPRGGDGGDEGGGAGDGDDAQVPLGAGAHEAVAGVVDAGRARVRDERHRGALFHHPRQLLGALALVVLVVADGARADAEVFEQRARPARVLARDHVHLREHAQRTPRHVLQIPDGRGDEIERPCGLRHGNKIQ